MTKAEFISLPLLLREHQVVAATGYTRNTLRKMVDCAVLDQVRPKGSAEHRYRKLQVGKLLGYEEKEMLEVWRAAVDGRPLLMGEKSVRAVTGYDRKLLAPIREAGGLTAIRPAGIGQLKYRVEEIAELVGMVKSVRTRSKESEVGGGALTGRGDS